MAEFFVIKNESIHVANIGYAVWNPADRGLDGNIMVHAGGRVFSVGFLDPEAARLAEFVGFADKLAALTEARKAKAAAVEDQKAAEKAAPLSGGLGRPKGREPARV